MLDTYCVGSSNMSVWKTKEIITYGLQETVYLCYKCNIYYPDRYFINLVNSESMSNFVQDDGGHLFPCENCVFDACVRIQDESGKLIQQGLESDRNGLPPDGFQDGLPPQWQLCASYGRDSPDGRDNV